jgi:hypothetical protein
LRRQVCAERIVAGGHYYIRGLNSGAAADQYVAMGSKFARPIYTEPGGHWDSWQQRGRVAGLTRMGHDL